MEKKKKLPNLNSYMYNMFLNFPGKCPPFSACELFGKRHKAYAFVLLHVHVNNAFSLP